MFGAGAAAVGAVAYGVTIVLGRSLAKSGLGVPTTLGLRFTLAAVFLFVVLAATRRPLVPERGERWAAYLLGAAGYMTESTFFFLGLERGTAAAVALIFYSYPVIVTLIEIPLGAGRPTARTIQAVTLSSAGTVLVVVSGEAVSISGRGIAFVFGAAVAFSAYVLAGARLLKRTNAFTNGAWLALGAGSSFLTWGGVSGRLRPVDGHWPALAGTGLATAAAFSLMFVALRRIGPARTAVIFTLEAFSAVALAAVFLGERIGVVQIIGGAGVLGGAGLIASAKPEPIIEGGGEAP